GNGFEVVGRLLFPEHAVQVTADGNMVCVSCNLADMIVVVNNGLKGCPVVEGIRFAPDPIGHNHPDVQGTTNYGIPLNQTADLVVVQLALVRNDGTAVMMARPNRALVYIQCLIKSLIGKVCHVEDNAQPVHFFE